MQLALGNLTTSLTRLGEAQTLVTANLGSSHPHLIPVHLLQAMILSETGEFDPGLSRTKDALAISSSPSTGQPSLPAGHPLSIEAITMLARIELRRQHGDEARQFARQAWTTRNVSQLNSGTWPD